MSGKFTIISRAIACFVILIFWCLSFSSQHCTYISSW